MVGKGGVNKSDDSDVHAARSVFRGLAARRVSVVLSTRVVRCFALAGCAAVAVSSTAQPTGIERVDIFLLSLLGIGVAVMLRVTPSAVWAGIAVLTVFATGVLGVGGQLLVAACSLVAWRRYGPFGRPVAASEATRQEPVISGETLVAAASIGTTSALLRLQDVVVDRSSAGVAAAILILLVVTAFAGLPVRRRRALLGTGFAIVGFGVGVSIATAMSVADLRGDAASAAAVAQESARLFRAGDTGNGLQKLGEAEAALEDINEELDSGWTRVALGIPVTSQNVQAVRVSATSAHALVQAAVSFGETANFEELLEDGSVDFEVLDHVRGALTDFDQVATDGERQIADAASPWLAPVVREEMTRFSKEVAGLRPAVETVDGIAEIMPQLLGATSRRNYLVLVGNPAEARELGGFAGGFAVVSALDGELSVVQSGRAPDLGRTPTTEEALTSGPFEYPQRFLEHRPWKFGQNYTAMADLPTLSRALGTLFPAMGGRSIDGVLYLDPYGLEALVALTAPVHIPDFAISLTAESTADFFVSEQYRLFPNKDDRTAILATLVETVLDRLSGVAEIDTSRAGRLIEAVQQGRIAFAPLDSAELDVLKDLGAAGEFGHDGDGDFLAVSHLNAGPNKLDAYLHRTVRYEVTVDPDDVSLSAELVVTLRNDAPAGLSKYEANNQHELPASTNRAMLVVHTPHELLSISESAEPAFDRSFQEFGLWRHEQLVVVPPGESRTVRFELGGELDGSDTAQSVDYRLAIEHQPLVTVDDFSVMVVSDASTLLSEEFELRKPREVLVPIP